MDLFPSHCNKGHKLAHLAAYLTKPGKDLVYLPTSPITWGEEVVEGRWASKYNSDNRKLEMLRPVSHSGRTVLSADMRRIGISVRTG